MSSLFAALFALLASSFRTRAATAGGDPRASSPTCGLPRERAASLAPPPLRPALVGCVVPILVRLAAMSRDGSARHGPPLAPPSFRLALDQEIPPPSRKARSCGEHSRSNSAHEPSQPFVGCTPRPRRTAQVGNCGGAIHGGQIFASVPQTTFPEFVALHLQDRHRSRVGTVSPPVGTAAVE